MLSLVWHGIVCDVSKSQRRRGKRQITFFQYFSCRTLLPAFVEFQMTTGQGQLVKKSVTHDRERCLLRHENGRPS